MIGQLKALSGIFIYIYKYIYGEIKKCFQMFNTNDNK